MLNQIYIHYINTLFVLESFIISCWLLKGKQIGIGIGIGQFARKKSVSESATKNHDRASLCHTAQKWIAYNQHWHEQTPSRQTSHNAKKAKQESRNTIVSTWCLQQGRET